MTVVLMILASLCVVLIAMTGWLFGKVRIQTLDIEKLYDAVAQLALDDSKIRDAVTAESKANCDRYKQLDEKINKAAQTQEEAAEAIAKGIEKKWDSGLQNMLNWNPFDKEESEGN